MIQSDSMILFDSKWWWRSLLGSIPWQAGFKDTCCANLKSYLLSGVEPALVGVTLAMGEPLAEILEVRQTSHLQKLHC